MTYWEEFAYLNSEEPFEEAEEMYEDLWDGARIVSWDGEAILEIEHDNGGWTEVAEVTDENAGNIVMDRNIDRDDYRMVFDYNAGEHSIERYKQA